MGGGPRPAPGCRRYAAARMQFRMSRARFSVRPPLPARPARRSSGAIERHVIEIVEQIARMGFDRAQACRRKNAKASGPDRFPLERRRAGHAGRPCGGNAENEMVRPWEPDQPLRKPDKRRRLQAVSAGLLPLEKICAEWRGPGCSEQRFMSAFFMFPGFDSRADFISAPVVASVPDVISAHGQPHCGRLLGELWLASRSTAAPPPAARASAAPDGKSRPAGADSALVSRLGIVIAPGARDASSSASNCGGGSRRSWADSRPRAGRNRID